MKNTVTIVWIPRKTGVSLTILDTNDQPIGRRSFVRGKPSQEKVEDILVERDLLPVCDNLLFSEAVLV